MQDIIYLEELIQNVGYYLRNVDEGKNKMLVINALKTKIVARMFTVIKRNKFYAPIYIKKTGVII